MSAGPDYLIAVDLIGYSIWNRSRWYSLRYGPIIWFCPHLHHGTTNWSVISIESYPCHLNYCDTALLSVYDKTDLLDLAKGLHAAGVRLLGSGGTAKKIREAGIPIEHVVLICYLQWSLHSCAEMFRTSQMLQKCSEAGWRHYILPSMVVRILNAQMSLKRFYWRHRYSRSRYCIWPEGSRNPQYIPYLHRRLQSLPLRWDCLKAWLHPRRCCWRNRHRGRHSTPRCSEKSCACVHSLRSGRLQGVPRGLHARSRNH